MIVTLLDCCLTDSYEKSNNKSKFFCLLRFIASDLFDCCLITLARDSLKRMFNTSNL